MYVLDSSENTIKTKTEHKVVIDDFKSHFDSDCECYYTQDACPMCTINRAISKHTEIKNTSKCYYCEIRQDIIITISGEEYHISKCLENFIQEFFSYGFFRRYMHKQVLLLFTAHKTIEFRELK